MVDKTPSKTSASSGILTDFTGRHDAFGNVVQPDDLARALLVPAGLEGWATVSVQFGAGATMNAPWPATLTVTPQSGGHASTVQITLSAGGHLLANGVSLPDPSAAAALQAFLRVSAAQPSPPPVMAQPRALAGSTRTDLATWAPLLAVVAGCLAQRAVAQGAQALGRQVRQVLPRPLPCQRQTRLRPPSLPQAQKRLGHPSLWH